jgi:hypothetical protein
MRTIKPIVKCISEYSEEMQQWLKDNKNEFVYPEEEYKNQMKGGHKT